MPQQPEIEDPIDMALWRLNCMTQLRQEVLDMFTIIEGKVQAFEQKLKSETGRKDDNKLLYTSFFDYQDSCRLSRERLEILLNRDLQIHKDNLEDAKLNHQIFESKKQAWLAEL